MIVVVSISSAIPCASLPITFALAGAIITTSACFAMETCSTLNWKFLSKVSTRHLFPVRVSKVIGLIKFVAFCVISTCTCAWSFFSALARYAILYAAILPVTPRRTVLPFNISFSSSGRQCCACICFIITVSSVIATYFSSVWLFVQHFVEPYENLYYSNL